MKIIVNHSRQDPLVSPEANPQVSVASPTASEEELNTEVELLRSNDLLTKVVQATGLDKLKTLGDRLSISPADPRVRTERAARKLAKEMVVEAVKKSNIIQVTYPSSDPQRAAAVLTAVAKDYMEKHLEVNHPQGAVQFFEDQTSRYRQGLAEIQAKLSTFSQDEQVSAAPLMRDASAQKLADFDSTLRTTQASIGETEERIQDLESQLSQTPARMDTAVQSADSSMLLESLNSTLLSLELKRTELLTKYDSNYKLVKEVDAQIAQAHDAIQTAESAPLLTKTSDSDPTHEYLREELAKAKADLATFRGRAAAMAAALRAYRQDSVKMEQNALQQENLLRESKADEDNYLLYLKKQEEARIADALDTDRIVNVAIAEPPVVPALPATSPVLFTLLGALLAAIVSVILAFVAEYFDPSFRTADQVSEFLDVPVFASIPKN